ncbi:MAG: flagellar motor switch protein FliM [Deltaproteobacteria bacterium]|nr:flagellar motor switch protein FliM [Deltaproteobacteria bacterium]
MAEKILTQEEVDALLRGVSSGNIETESDKSEPAAGIRAYDLTQQERVIRGRMPALEIINERFCRLFRASLFNFLRKTVDVSTEGIKMTKYSDFIKNTPVPASFNIIQISPLRGLTLLVLDANLVFMVVDNFFGGGGKYHTRVEGRDFSSTEQRIIRKIIDMTFQDMKTSWEPVHPVNFIYNRSEVNPQFINVVVPTEVVLSMTFKIEIDAASSIMRICIPYASIEPIKEKLYASYQSDRMDVDKRWLSKFEDEIRKTSVSVACEIGMAEVSIGDFLNLNTGDIIQLDNKSSEPISVKIEGVTKYTGKPGILDGHYAIAVQEFLSKGGD